jgi:hypothetical protein
MADKAELFAALVIDRLAFRDARAAGACDDTAHRTNRQGGGRDRRIAIDAGWV